MVHFHIKYFSTNSSRRNSRDSSSWTSDTTLEGGKNRLFKQLYLHQQQGIEQPLPTSRSSNEYIGLQLSPSSITNTSSTSNTLSTAITNYSSTNLPPRTKLHRLNTANHCEYGKCYKCLREGSTAIISVCRSKKINSTSDKQHGYKLYAVKKFLKNNKPETEKDFMK